MKYIDIPLIRRGPKIEIEPQRLTKMLAGNRKIFVAIPEEHGSVKISTMLAIMDSQVDRLTRGWAFDIGTTVERPVSTARNLMVARFLASDCDDLVFIDHDINWEPGALCRLIDHPVDFVAGVPRFRGDPEGYPVRWDASQPYIVADPVTGLLKVEGIPFAFVRIRRAALERMVAAYPDRELDHPGAPGGIIWDLFEFGRFGRSRWSEDMTFCRLYREIGGEIWIDPYLKFSHTGEKAFVGSLAEFMRGRPEAEAEAELYVKGMQDKIDAAAAALETITEGVGL